MGTLPLAAYSIAYSLEPVCFMLPIGLSTALSNSVGNQLGANRVVAAKKLAITGIGVGLLVVLLYTALVWLGGDALAAMFTTDPAVLAATREMWPSFIVFMFISGPFAMMLGLNRGLGLQRANAACVIGLVWPLGAPLVLFWASTPSNVWQALSVTYTLLVCAMVLCATCSSWELLAQKAMAASDKASQGRGHVPDESEMHESSGTRGGLAAADSAKAATTS